MWSRRRFLESVAGWPLVGPLVGASGASAAPAAAGRRDYFRELGVRPFINAAGAYTAMTASLMGGKLMGWPLAPTVDRRALKGRPGRRRASVMSEEYS